MKHYLFIDFWTMYFPNDGIDHDKVVFHHKLRNKW